VKYAPTISIIIPVFNEADHLQRCLSTIEAQTLTPYEIVVVDNNSTDDTVRIARTHPLVRVVTEKKQGIVHARNAGFNAARGDIIARIDADTILPPDWVQRVCSYYTNDKNLKTALTGGGYFYNIRIPRFNGWLQGQIAFRMNRFIAGHYILWGSNMAFPVAMWQAVKQDTCTRDDIHEDMDLAIHLHRLGYGITYLESLRVGVKLKRVWEDRWEQRKHLARWPRTLRTHGYRLWWLGSVGNVGLALLGEPYIFVSEFIARVCARPRLPR
jgi:glycosyltransferase involved in cell wall biosynthesis